MGRVIRPIALNPALDGKKDESNRWHGEYMKQISRVAGWWKSTRYGLISRYRVRMLQGRRKHQ